MRNLYARFILFISRIWKIFRILLLRPAFKQYGRNFTFDPDGSYTFGTISVGDHVSLGQGPILLALCSQIQIGSHVMFGPEVTIRGGNHRIDMLGRFMNSVKNSEKRPEDDLGVVIEDDVWVGTRAIILHGVTIGRGSVVAAGAVVTKSVPPYAIVAGVPAKVIKFRWNVDTIIEHEKILYPLETRLTKEELERQQAEIMTANN